MRKTTDPMRFSVGEQLTILLFGVVIGLALIVLVMGYEDIKAKQPWGWKEVAVAGTALTLALAGAYGMIWGW